MMSDLRIDTAVVLAGGLGTRLRSVVAELPKPMAPVASKPFLEHQFTYWIAQGIRRFIVSVGYRHEAISGHFGNEFGGAELSYVVEATPMGTGGGLLLAANELDSAAPFLLLNGDTYFAVSLRLLESYAHRHDSDWCFSLFSTSEKDRYMGMALDASGRITSLGVAAAEASVQMVNGGVYVVHPRALADYLGNETYVGRKVSLEDDILKDALMSGKRLFGMPSDGLFIDIGVPDDYQRAQTLLSNISSHMD